MVAGQRRRYRGAACNGNGKGRRRRPSLWFLVHSWLGLKLSFVLLLLLVTGSVATVSHEIDWLFDERVRAAPQGDILDLGRLFARVETTYPGAFIPFASLAPGEGNAVGTLPFAAAFQVVTPDGAYRSVFIDPYSGAITGERSFDFPAFMRQFHYTLFVPKGLFLTTLFGFVLLGSLVTGLVTYKKFWRGFLRLPRRHRGARVFWGDLHRLLGLWSLWFVLLMAVTSIWYLAEEILDLSGLPMYEQDAPSLQLSDLDGLGPEVAGPMPLASLLAIAREAIPELQIRDVMRLGHPLEAVRIGGQTDAILLRDRTSHVYLNPYDGAILRVQRGEELDLFTRWTHTADPLHFGTFGGLATKLPWFVFGLILSAITLSGTLIFLKRTAAATAAYLPAVAQADNGARGRLSWLGRWRWPNVLIVLTPLVAFTVQSLPGTPPSNLRSLGTRDIGPWNAELLVEPTAARDRDLAVTVRFCAGCFRQTKSVFLAWDDEAHRLDPASLVQGAPYDLGVALPAPADDADPELVLTVTDWQNNRYRARWYPFSFEAGRATAPRLHRPSRLRPALALGRRHVARRQLDR